MSRQWMTPLGFLVDESGTDTHMLPAAYGFAVAMDQDANTENKRRCAGALWWDTVRPVPDTSVDAPDRANVGWTYCGIDYVVAAARKAGRLLLLGAGHGT